MVQGWLEDSFSILHCNRLFEYLMQCNSRITREVVFLLKLRAVKLPLYNRCCCNAILETVFKVHKGCKSSTWSAHIYKCDFSCSSFYCYLYQLSCRSAFFAVSAINNYSSLWSDQDLQVVHGLISGYLYLWHRGDMLLLLK